MWTTMQRGEPQALYLRGGSHHRETDGNHEPEDGEKERCLCECVCVCMCCNSVSVSSSRSPPMVCDLYTKVCCSGECCVLLFTLHFCSCAPFWVSNNTAVVTNRPVVWGTSRSDSEWDEHTYPSLCVIAAFGPAFHPSSQQR